MSDNVDTINDAIAAIRGAAPSSEAFFQAATELLRIFMIDVSRLADSLNLSEEQSPIYEPLERIADALERAYPDVS